MKFGRSERTTRVQRALILFVCALFLLAQHVAVGHALWHATYALVSDDGNVAASDGTRDSPNPAVSNLCIFDAAFGQVLGGAPSASHSFPLEAAARGIPPHVADHVAAVERLTPHSRDPPALL